MFGRTGESLNDLWRSRPHARALDLGKPLFCDVHQFIS
jgi:hypothetical protein